MSPVRKPVKRQEEKSMIEQQIFYGGMPTSKVKAPKIKLVDKKPALPKTKKFTLNAFLDKYLNENKPPKTNYEKLLEDKYRE